MTRQQAEALVNDMLGLLGHYSEKRDEWEGMDTFFEGKGCRDEGIEILKRHGVNVDGE